MDAVGLRSAIEALCSNDIACQTPAQPDGEPRQVAQAVSSELSAKILQRKPGDSWRVTSYSGLQQRGQGIAQDLIRDWISMPQASVRLLKSQDLHRISSRAALRRVRSCMACLKISILRNRWIRIGSRSNWRWAVMTHTGRRF